MHHQKRGQVSVLIFVGIFLLLVAILLFSLREQKISAPQNLPELTQEVPFDAAPIQSFVTGCVEKVSKEALMALSQHSGYIDPASAEYGTPVFRADEQNPTAAEALTFAPGWNVPYWHYLASPNQETRTNFKPQAPSDNDVEKQVNLYVEKNLAPCLENFASFTAQGFAVTPQGPVRADASLTETDVVVDVNLPLKISKGAAVFELKQFRARHDVALKKLLDFSRHVTNTLVQSQPIEKVMLLMLSGYGGLNNELPPMTESQFGGQKATWRESAVKPKVESILSYAIEKVPVKGTANYVPFEQRDPTLAADRVRLGTYRYLDSLEIPSVPGIDARVYTVDFTYLPAWPSYFDVVRGDVIGPSDENALPDVPIVSELLSFLAPHLRRYQTPYDVSIPVLITIKDTKAFNNKGHEFQFAVEANVRDNEPLTAQFQPFARATGYNTGFGQLCNENQKTSPPVTIKVTDAMKNTPVSNADLSFGGCSAGVTGADGTFHGSLGPKALLELRVSAENYLAQKKQLFSTMNERTADIKLTPLVEKKIRVQKYNYNKIAKETGIVHSLSTDVGTLWERATAPVDLLPQETAMVSFERVSTDGIAHSAGAPVSGTGQGTVMLAPGRYKISITTLLNEQIFIPRCEDCQCSNYEVQTSRAGRRHTVCTAYLDVDELRSGPPFTEGTIEYVTDITPQMLNSPQDLKLFTLVMNLRDVPDTRIMPPPGPGGLILIRERMVSDLQLLEKMRQDATNDVSIRERIKPVLVSS